MSNHCGFFNNSNNNVMHSTQLVYLMSSMSSYNHGLYIYQSNIRQVIALYGARRLSLDSFISHEDVYIVREDINK